MSELTSEKIAKALKGAGLSSKQRVQKAQEAWSNEAIFFPNKDEFLFDWISSAFAKPNLKKMDDCCLVQLPYWNLLAELLQHYESKSHNDRSIPIIHVNFVASISTLLQLLYKNYADKVQERIEFLSISRKCLDIILSDSFNSSYRPAFEHVSSAVDQVLDSLSLQIDLCSKGNEELTALQELCAMAQTLFRKFDSQLVLAANQKKIFLSVVEKSLSKLLLVRRRINSYNDRINTSDISQISTDIVCHSLFHADTVLEFTSVLKDVSATNSNSGNVKQTNYVVKLFETLDNMVKKQNDGEMVLDTVDIFPTLLSAFLESFRKKRNTSTSAMQDISRMAEFGMFTSLLNTLSIVKDKAVTAYLKTLCLLLQEALTWNIYTARNDEIGNAQIQLLNTIADDVVTYLKDSNKYNQSLVLDLANALLQIDFSLIETRVQSLWPVMLNSEESAHESCLVFAKSILQTYSASRQIDVFITDLVLHIQQIQSDDLLTVLEKPMFSQGFLNEFSSTVSKSMPVAQYLSTFTEFQNNLVANIVSDKHKSKKQKKEKTEFKNKSWIVALISMYFVEFVQALKLSQHQLKNFEAPVMFVYDSFVKPCISNWNDSKSNVESSILPAIQIHSALSAAFFRIYISKFEASELEWLAKSYSDIFKKYKKAETMLSRLIIVTTVNAMLQHAYYATLLQNSSDTTATELVNLVIDYVTEDDKGNTWYNTAHWDGSILGLKDKFTLKVACWKLLSDEWFESIVRFADAGRAQRLVSLIHMSLINETTSDSAISVQLLNKILLRSANFYEAECFKDCNIPVILKAIVELFNTKLSASVSSNDAVNMVSKVDISKTLDIEQKDVEQLSQALCETDNAMDEDVDTAITNYANQLGTLLKLLLLFPTEYIEKNERLQIVYLATLIDIWSVSCHNADSLHRMKVSLMCRGLQLKFIDYFSTHSILGMDYKILEWLVLSNKKWPIQRTVEFDTTYKALEHETNRLDFLILRKIISSAGSKIPDEYALSYFENSLTQRTVNAVEKQKEGALGELINFLAALNSVLGNRKPTEESNIYAKSNVSKISKFVISALEEAKSTISTLSDQVGSSNDAPAELITSSEPTFKRIGRILHLTRLLQNYALTVGSNVDEVIAAQELSKTLTNLASPFIQFLQATLSSKELENDTVLDMTTDFIAAFCSILSRYQQVDTTKRVLAAVWFVYSLVFNTGNEESLSTLSNAFASWIQSLTKEQYTILFDSFIEQAEEEAANRANVEKEQHHLVYLSLFSLLLSHCTISEKGRLRKQIPSIILKLSLVAGKTSNLKYLEQLLKLLIQITGDQTYHMSDYDASILLSCAMQVAHPTASERFKTQITAERANEIFIDVCSILSNFISQHKEQLVYMLPPFIAFVQSLFHCFKSSHVSLVSDTRKRKRDTSQKNSGRSISLLQVYAPLDNVSAQKFARVLTTIPQKQHLTVQKNAKSTQSMQKIISKHTPSLLIEYFTIQSNSTMTIVNPSIKSILTNALYDILDLCSDNDRNFVLSCLDGSGKSLFKDFYSSWKENHKYSGQ